VCHEGVCGRVELAVGGGEWSALCPGCFTHMERTPFTHERGGWVGPRASLDVLEKTKSFVPAGTRKLGEMKAVVTWANVVTGQ
jgi:hypothetical protein